MKSKIIPLCLAMVFISFPCIADSFFQWHSTNVQLLRGYQYELGDEKRTIFTFEHANGFRYGDFFGFLDYLESDDGTSTYYGELSPRFSLKKMTGVDASFGPLKDLSIAYTLEKPKGNDENHLYGIGTDWEAPGFDFLKVNFYIRDNPNLSGDTTQITISWKNSFKIGNSSWMFEGFADLAGEEGNSSDYELIVPRLLYDLHNVFSLDEKTLWVGVEYSYWRNKFGIRGVDEKVPQFQIIWVI